MSDFANCIVSNNTRDALKRFTHIINIAQKNGAIITTDKRTVGVTMTPCVEWLRTALTNLNIRVDTIHLTTLWSSTQMVRMNKPVFVFCNLWAMSPNKVAFQRIKKSPWVALQTEHKGHRVYERPKCHYRWFLRNCDQVWDFGFDFCEGSQSIFLPSMWYPMSMSIPSNMIHQKSKEVTFLGICDKGSDRDIILTELRKLLPGRTVFGNNLSIKESLNLFRISRTGIMIPRQSGNFEFHRFGAYAISCMRIVCLKTQNIHSAVQYMLSPMVDFVDTIDKLISNVIDITLNSSNNQIEIEKRYQWFRNQNIDHLLRDVFENTKIEPLIKQPSNLLIKDRSQEISKVGHTKRHIANKSKLNRKLLQKITTLYAKMNQ